MRIGFGNHFMADLYLCQNELWDSPNKFKAEISKITDSKSHTSFNWRIMEKPCKIQITGELDNSYILLQVFPEKKFLTLDIFFWNYQEDIQRVSDGLVEMFAPQVVASESRLRAEHLS